MRIKYLSLIVRFLVVLLVLTTMLVSSLYVSRSTKAQAPAAQPTEVLVVNNPEQQIPVFGGVSVTNSPLDPVKVFSGVLATNAPQFPPPGPPTPFTLTFTLSPNCEISTVNRIILTDIVASTAPAVRLDLRITKTSAPPTMFDGLSLNTPGPFVANFKSGLKALGSDTISITVSGLVARNMPAAPQPIRVVISGYCADE